MNNIHLFLFLVFFLVVYYGIMKYKDKKIGGDYK